MHTAIDHEGHQTDAQPASAPQPNVMPGTSGRQCAHCGFALEQGFSFCPNCGMNLKTAECPACGQKVDPAWSSCTYCGSPLGEAEKQAAVH
jgi:predicted amidophosphoribosyltransferase